MDIDWGSGAFSFRVSDLLLLGTGGLLVVLVVAVVWSVLRKR